MSNFVTRIMDRTFALGGALLFAQFPEFFTQYTHELKGHLSELSRQVSLIQEAARLSSKTPEGLIRKFLENGDPDFQRQGTWLQEIFDRFQHFSNAINAFDGANIFQKPLVFVKYFDIEIAQDTLHHFTLGIPLNTEGVIWALFGAFFGVSVLSLMTRLSEIGLQGLRKLSRV